MLCKLEKPTTVALMGADMLAHARAAYYNAGNPAFGGRRHISCYYF